MSNSTSLAPSPHLEPIKGISIFWPLFTIALASALHPLGSTAGESSPRYRYYTRALPLSALLDSLFFLSQCEERGSTTCVLARLDANNPNLIQPLLSSDEDSKEAINGFLDFVVDFNARLVPGVFIVLAYTKLCTYSGVPGSLALASVYFLSWILLEGTLIAQHFRRGNVSRQMLQRAATLPQRKHGILSPRNVRTMGRLLFALQVLVFLCIGITVLIRHTPPQHPRPDASPPPVGFTTVLAYLFAPTVQVWDWAMPIMITVEEKFWSLKFFLAIPYLFLVLMPCFMGLIIWCLGLSFVLNGAVLLSPFWVLYVCYCEYRSIQWALKVTMRVGLIPGGITVFPFVFLGGMLRYYAVLFDPSGVSKRAWNDVLG